ncbi:MAG: glycosyltransferase family 4 protein [Candidatus Rokuibacteriota bacterium]
MKITVLTFDVSDNATGRADLLARLLAPRYEVSVVGPQFGPRPWSPVTGGTIDYRAVPAHRYPAFAADVRALLDRIDGDVLYASKPRPSSYGLALLARRRRWRPLLLDVDDWELGFYYRSGAWGRLGRALNLANPNGLAWTWLCERLIPAADALTVASRFLERRFGGTLLPHVRDTDAWNPERYDPAVARSALGIGRSPLVMFLGTPRGYKGVDDLVEAVARLGGEVALAIVGVKPDSEAARRWRARPFVRIVGEVPFDDVPRYLAAAAVVAVPQRATTDTLGQVPAKLFDAMALGRPIVATAVSMIPEILDGCGVVVPPGDVGRLADAIRRLVDEPETAAELGRRARARCVAEYSFTAARARLFPLIDQLAATRA